MTEHTVTHLDNPRCVCVCVCVCVMSNSATPWTGSDTVEFVCDQLLHSAHGTLIPVHNWKRKPLPCLLLCWDSGSSATAQEPSEISLEAPGKERRLTGGRGMGAGPSPAGSAGAAPLYPLLPSNGFSCKGIKFIICCCCCCSRVPPSSHQCSEYPMSKFENRNKTVWLESLWP